MKNRILAGVMVLAAGTSVLLLTGDSSICPEECPGKQCQPIGDRCLMIDEEGGPNLIDEDGKALEVADLEAEKRTRMLICCNTEDGIERKDVVWTSETPPQNCQQVIPPGKFGGVSMNGVDLGHAGPLNLVCCQRPDGSVVKGSWGACPRCAYRCVAGRPVLDPKGCDDFCGEAP